MMCQVLWLVEIHACMPAESLQPCPTLCDPVDSSPPGSSVHGILQARTLEWVATPSSRGASPPRDQTHISYASCIGRRILDHERAPPGKPSGDRVMNKNDTVLMLEGINEDTKRGFGDGYRWVLLRIQVMDLQECCWRTLIMPPSHRRRSLLASAGCW